jgi:hypothetical protein
MRTSYGLTCWTAALALCGAHGAAVAQQGDDRRGYEFSGEAGTQEGPFTLSGPYVFYAHATFFQWKHQLDGKTDCAFIASVRGLDHAVPDGSGTLGTGWGIPDIPAWHVEHHVVLEPGRYQLWVSPLTDCDWEVSILPMSEAATPPVVDVRDLQVKTAVVIVRDDGTTQATDVLRPGGHYRYILLATTTTAATSLGSVSGVVTIIQRNVPLVGFGLTPTAAVSTVASLEEERTFLWPEGAQAGPATVRFGVKTGGSWRDVDQPVTLAP